VTITRGLSVSALVLLATVVLVGYCGVAGILLWLLMVNVPMLFPSRTWRVLTQFQPRAAFDRVADAWVWLDRR
jgi:hypothetical protein